MPSTCVVCLRCAQDVFLVVVSLLAHHSGRGKARDPQSGVVGGRLTPGADHPRRRAVAPQPRIARSAAVHVGRRGGAQAAQRQQRQGPSGKALHNSGRQPPPATVRQHDALAEAASRGLEEGAGPLAGAGRRCVDTQHEVQLVQTVGQGNPEVSESGQ